ncbi:hypothetical protein M0657_004678 [Pyricularia oryzae]|uniref:Uncharacterized protein n=1 Tax=Pyricularia oryzae (strain Y34) TaxID=1143189 RepID=A0AA97P750_PYRO3|nr:hypothetical protein OOU_Y34scaffold00162g12 [Pyricularia oryzae Y34]KAI7924333.1 hypothetical protein M0657_004678 [Pyricularia oryzae]
MRFSVILTGAFAAVAMAQSTTPTTASAPTPVGLTPQQSSALACLEKCNPSDVNCRAACNGVPFPNDGQVNTTNQCVADCSKQYGNGTEADNARFIKCSDDCINKNYWNPSSGTPNPTGNSGSSSNGNGNSNGNSGSKTTGGSNPTNTGSSSSATGSSAADALRIGSSIAGVVGFMAALLAM